MPIKIPHLSYHMYHLKSLVSRKISSPTLQKHARPVPLPTTAPGTYLRDGAGRGVHVLAVAVLRARGEGAAVLALRVFLLEAVEFQFWVSGLVGDKPGGGGRSTHWLGVCRGGPC